MQPIRIIISGPSGSGKTTLAMHLSKRLAIRPVMLSASEVWREFGIRSHKEAILLCANSPELGMKYQEAILRMRAFKLDELVADNHSFVCDRGFLDAATYFLMQNIQHYNEAATVQYLTMCAQLDAKYHATHILLDPLPVVQYDGKRIPNLVYSKMTHTIMSSLVSPGMMGYMHNPNTPYYFLPDKELYQRVDLVVNIVERGLRDQYNQYHEER